MKFTAISKIPDTSQMLIIPPFSYALHYIKFHFRIIISLLLDSVFTPSMFGVRMLGEELRSFIREVCSDAYNTLEGCSVLGC
jgi:hypothetical protein